MSGISKWIPSHARLATKFVVNALIGMRSTGTWFRSAVVIKVNNTFVSHKIILILHKHSLRLLDETMTQLLLITVFLVVCALWSLVTPNLDWTIRETLALLIQPKHAGSNKVIFIRLFSFCCCSALQIYSSQPEMEDLESISWCFSSVLPQSTAELCCPKCSDTGFNHSNGGVWKNSKPVV